jgi:hypothetical protein
LLQVLAFLFQTFFDVRIAIKRRHGILLFIRRN